MLMDPRRFKGLKFEMLGIVNVARVALAQDCSFLGYHRRCILEVSLLET